jgi:hypothetical protein
MPVACRSSSGSRAQPPRPITAASFSVPSVRVSVLSRPSRMWTTRSAIAAVDGSWLTTTTVVPAPRASSAIRSCTTRALAASSSPAGSSARSSSGPWARAAHSATRCCSPPDSSTGGRRRGRAARPDRGARRRGAPRPPRRAVEGERQAHDRPHAEVRRQRPVGVLVDDAEPTGAPGGRAAPREQPGLHAEDRDASCRRRLEAAQQPQDGALPGPARPEDEQRLARPTRRSRPWSAAVAPRAAR